MWDRRFIVVGGKGGVGRTTVAVALATVLARRGRRILLAHVRTQQRVAQLLGVTQEVDEEIRLMEPNLWAVNMNPEAALREKGLMVLRFKAVYRAVMENRVVRYFLRAVPALNEYSMLGKAWYHTTEVENGRPKYDTVIFDGPAMGHLVTMLRIPQVIVETVPDGPLTVDAHQVIELLSDPSRAALWIVAQAEEMPVRETVELYQRAEIDLGIVASCLVVNALYPERFHRDSELSEALALLRRYPAAASLSPILASAETLRDRRVINDRYLHQLYDLVPLPRIELPYLFAPSLDRTALDILAQRIESAITTLSGPC